MSAWGTVVADANMEYSWPNVPPLPRPNNNTQDVPPWGSPDRPSAPSENNLSSKKAAQDSWGQNKSENSYINRNEVVQVDRFPERSFPERGPTKLSDNVNMRSPLGIDKLNDQRDDEEEYASLAYQAVTQQSFESLKNKEQIPPEILEDDSWDPDYHNIPSPQLDTHNIKGRAESSTTASPIPTSSRKKFHDVEVQTDPVDLTKIVASNQKLLSCTIDSQAMRDYQQDVSDKRHQPQQPITSSLLDLDPEEWENSYSKHTNAEDWNTSSGKADFHDNIIPPTIPETNAREPDNNSRRPIQVPPNNENLPPNNNLDLDSGPQPETEQANGWGAPTGKSDRGNVSQQTPTQDIAYNQPVRDNQNNNNDRPSDVSNDNLGGQQSNVNKDSWEANAGGSDWMKQREMFTKELGINNNAASWEQPNKRTEESYGTFNDRSSSNNRYGSRDGNRDSNRYGSRKTCNNCGSEDHLARDCPDESSRGGFGGRSCHKCGEEGHFARDCTNESSRGGFGGRSCHKCGEEGHFARDCTNEGSRIVRTCHKCGKEGHISRECPEDVCYKCNKPGHHANDCKEDAYETTGQDGSFGERSRDYRTKSSPFSDPRPPNISSEDAWSKLIEADGKGDIDDFKEALDLYAKVTPVETFQSIEMKLRESHCKARIIALKREEIPLTQVLMDLQGTTNKRYVAMPVMDPTRLPRTAGELAPTDRENYEWLADAGFMVDDPGPVCHNCKQKGHLSRDCREPKREIEKHPSYTCQRCKLPGHLTRECPEERNDYYTEVRDRKIAGSHNRDPVNDDKASIYDEEGRKGFRGYGSSSSQTCHNCHQEGHISRDCPEKRSGGGGGGRRCFKCGEEGHMSKDCNKGNYNDYNKAASSDTYGDNSRSKTEGDSTFQDVSWNKSGGGGSATSRDDQNYNNYAQNREVKNVVARDSSLSTQDKTLQQKTIPPPVEPDSWEAPMNTSTTQKVENWGYKTLDDFNWGKSNNNNNQASDEDYGNKREDSYNKVSDYGNRPSRGNDSSYNKGPDDFDNRRGRGNNNSYNNSDDYDSKRRGNYNNSDERGRGGYNNSDDHDRRGRGNNNNSYNNYNDDYESRRGRGNSNSYNNSDDYDSKRSRGNYNNSDERGGRGGYNNSDDYDRRGRGNNSYNRSGDDYGRNRGGNSYNKSDDYGRARGNDSYNRSSDDYGRGRNDSYNNDYGRGRGSDSYNRSSDDYGRSRNDSYNRSDDYGRGRGSDSYNRSYNNDYGRGRGNDSYNKGSGDYGRNRGNDYSYNRGSDNSYDRRDRDDSRWTKSNRSQEPRDQTTQSNDTPGPNLDNQPWW